MDVKNCKCYCKKQIDNNFPRSVLLSTIEIKSSQNVENFAVKPLVCGSWFHLSFKHFEAISIVDKSTVRGKLLNLTQIYSPFSFKLFYAFIRIQFYKLHDSIKLGLGRRLAWQPFISSLHVASYYSSLLYCFDTALALY